MCFFAGCEIVGTWRPVLVLKSNKKDKGSKMRFRDDSKVAVCDEHRDSLTCESYLSPEGLSVLARHMRERAQPIPDKKHTVLKWEKIEP